MAEKKKSCLKFNPIGKLLKSKRSSINPDGDPYEFLPVDQAGPSAYLTTSALTSSSAQFTNGTSLTYNVGSDVVRSNVTTSEDDVTVPRLRSQYIQVTYPPQSASRDLATQRLVTSSAEERQEDSIPSNGANRLGHRKVKYYNDRQFSHLEAAKSPSCDNEYTSHENEQYRCSPPQSDQNAADLHDPPQNHHNIVGPPGYLPKTQYRLSVEQPPGLIQRRLNELSVKRSLAAINVTSRGGTFTLFCTNYVGDLIHRDDVMVIVPEACFTEETKLYFLKSRNEEDFPPEVPRESHRSDVIHMLPHGKTFPKPITVRIPLFPAATNSTSFSLMYSDSNSGDRKPIWTTLQKKQPTVTTNDISCAYPSTEPEWFFSDGYLFLFVTHFCMFLVVEQPTGSGGVIELPARPLMVSIGLKYNPRVQVITVAVYFSDKPTTKEDEIDQIKERSNFVLCMNKSDVSVTLQTDDHWVFLGGGEKTKKVPYVELSNIATMMCTPKVKFNLQCTNICHDDLDPGVFMTFKIGQTNCDTKLVELDPFNLSEITGSDRPAVLGRCNSLMSVKQPEVDKADHDADLLEVTLPHIRENYSPFDRNPIPDLQAQKELAAILDPNQGWKLIADAFQIHISDTDTLHNLTPTACVLYAYGSRGRLCNWFEFSDELVALGYADAAEVLRAWYSEQTEVKRVYYI